MSAETPVVDSISIDELMNDQSVLLQRESATRALLNAQLIDVSADSLKPTLLNWASLGFPSGFVLIQIRVDVPRVCSDGVTRTLSEYMEFCMGPTFSTISSSLSQKLVGIQVSFGSSDDTYIVYVTKR